MSLSVLGKNTSPVEVTHVSKHGIWLLVDDRELFMSYDHFPWFKDVPVGKILNVEEPTPGHFYWPDLDVDLSEEIIAHPERFPLKASKPEPDTPGFLSMVENFAEPLRRPISRAPKEF